MAEVPEDDIVVRLAEPSDRDAIVGLGARSLGWVPDERTAAFLAWKHDHNPFGPSPAWVAVHDGRVVAFRVLLRWELAHPERGRLRLVRAVDTATDPDFQGRGLFRRLTLGALDVLEAEGVDAVFNTPNEQSRPGYLKMGWHQLGRPAVSVRPGSVRRLAAAALRRERAAAERWSEPCDAGIAARDVDEWPAAPTARGWATPRTAEYLRWRYRFPDLHYRVAEVAGGSCVFRVRDRGGLRELVLCEWLSPRADRRAVGRLVRATAADHAIAIGLGWRHGTVPVPRLGPVVTWRPLRSAGVPDLDDLSFSLGDVELF
jgi:GNAT superfamily N-acetyltransferase